MELWLFIDSSFHFLLSQRIKYSCCEKASVYFINNDQLSFLAAIQGRTVAVLNILQKRSKVQMVMSKSHASLMTFRFVPSALPSGKAAFTSEVTIKQSQCLPVSLYIDQKPMLKKCSVITGMCATLVYGFFRTKNNCRAFFQKSQIFFYRQKFA